MVSVPIGVPNPWGSLSQLSLVLLLIFSVDATITLWRRGDRRRALVLGGSMIFSTIFARARAARDLGRPGNPIFSQLCLHGYCGGDGL